MPSVEPDTQTQGHRTPRVLFVGRDPRYQAEAGRRLRALGYPVAVTRRPCEIVDLVRQHEVDVVVVDGSHYLAAIIRGMAAVEAARTTLAIMTVVEDALISPLSRPDIMPKWASLDLIAEHVELAFKLRSDGAGPPSVPAIALV
jgi:CheY-like chemotaxis protein